MEYFGGQIYWIFFKNLVKVNQWFQYNNLKVFCPLGAVVPGRKENHLQN
jgi:hypothetical protein